MATAKKASAKPKSETPVAPAPKAKAPTTKAAAKKAPKIEPGPAPQKKAQAKQTERKPVEAPLPQAPAPAAIAPEVVAPAQAAPAAPVFSVVIPIYNEERILYGAVEQLIDNLTYFKLPYEIILAENGSKDQTIAIGEQLSQKHPFVSIFHHPEPDYGLALKAGILRAKGRYVVCDEIDLCTLSFYQDALKLLLSGEAEMVIGSKALASSNDERPLGRRVATRVLNGMLRVSTGFKGTDTHGLKAFEREKMLGVLSTCQLGKDLFASEFVIRAERAGHMIVEVPLALREMRAPSVHLLRRVPKVLKDMARLTYLIRVKG